MSNSKVTKNVVLYPPNETPDFMLPRTCQPTSYAALKKSFSRVITSSIIVKSAGVSKLSKLCFQELHPVDEAVVKVNVDPLLMLVG